MKFRHFSNVAATLSVVYCVKHYSKVSLSLHANTSSRTITRHQSQFSKWSFNWFKNVKESSPVFFCSGKDIKVLTEPEDFYKEVKDLSSKAKRRITLASLYLGNGDKEQQLIDTIHNNLSHSTEPIKINVLLEYTRGSRGAKNSRTMLLPLVKEFTGDTNVALFHTPNLRGLLRKIIPARFNETINVSHLKVYLFDDTLIMSGANLSDDYFTNRQDRYIIFKDCKELCDYFDELVQTISKFSFKLQPDDTTTIHPDFAWHPYKDSKKTFNTEAGKLLNNFIEKHSKHAFRPEAVEFLNQSGTNTHNEINNFNQSNTSTQYGSGETKDTLVFPLLQMRTMGIQQDENVTRNIIASAPENTDLLLATAYFNLTDSYWHALLKSKPHIELLMAHPKAMGFYKAPGMAGGIPNAYSLISCRRYTDLSKKGELDRIRFHEFHRPGWTFHGKGLWAFLKSNDRDNDDGCPLLTLIGSPNFGKRSVYRDMEAQVAIVTTNSELKIDLLNERDNMWKDTTMVTRNTYDVDQRKSTWWVWIIATVMNELF